MSEHTPTFSSDWTSYYFADWQRWLGHFAGQPIRGLEVGSFEGRSALWFCEHILTHPEAGLICIDPWDYRQEKAVVPGGATHIAEQFDWRAVRRRFDANLRPHRDKLCIMDVESNVALTLVPRNPPLEFAYLDGSHTAAAVLSDAVMVWPSLGRGSILIFDDYTWQHNKHVDGWPDELLRPKLGIDRFLEVFACQYDSLEYSNDQVKLRKR